MFNFGVIPMPGDDALHARATSRSGSRAPARRSPSSTPRPRRSSREVRDQLPLAAPRDRRRRAGRGGLRALRRPVGAGQRRRADGRGTTARTTRCSSTSRRARWPRPKMVLHTHASMGAGHEITARFWQDLTPADLHWTFSDTGWAKAAWGKLFGQWRMGAAVFLWDQRGKFDPELCLRVLERSGVTTFCAPPTLFRAFVQLDLRAFDFRACATRSPPASRSTPRSSASGARRTGHDDLRRLRADRDRQHRRELPVPRGAAGLDGQADAGQRRGRRRPRRHAPRAGRGGPHRPRDRARAAGRADAGYWRDDAANAEAFHDGWYFTGDRAMKDEDGYFWFVGRDDDVIISASYRIGPFEVESALVEHPAVAESAVVGKPDPERTSIVKAFVVLAPGHQGSDALARELQEHVKRSPRPTSTRARSSSWTRCRRRSRARSAAASCASARDDAAGVRDRALLRGARVRRSVPALRLRRRAALMHELLAFADDETRDQWDSLVLGYTETLGAPLCEARSPRSTRRSRPTT